MRDRKPLTSLLPGRRRINRIAMHGALYFALFVVCYQFMYPLLKMLSQTFMSRDDIIDPTVQWLPTALSVQNLSIARYVLDFPRSLFGSIGYSALLAGCQTVIAALTGYAFARFAFKLKGFWFAMMLISFVVPIPVVMIPRTMIFQFLQDKTPIHFFGTPLPQVSMALLGQGVCSTILVLIFYSFIRMIPKSLDEAAMIDGANTLQVFFHIGIRVSLSTLLVVFLFAMVWNWNETYMTDTFLAGNIPLLPAMLDRFDAMFSSRAPMAGPQGGEARISEAYKMAGTLIAILPLLILYAFVQKRFIAGIENTGVTGE